MEDGWEQDRVSEHGLCAVTTREHQEITLGPVYCKLHVLNTIINDEEINIKSFLRNILFLLFLVTGEPGFLDGAFAESQLSLIGWPVSTSVVNRTLLVKDSQGYSCGSSCFGGR